MGTRRSTQFWRSEWFVGVVATVLVALSCRSLPMEGLDRAAYDLGIRVIDRAPSERIVVIAIDDRSLANLGDWPWPRDVHARLIDFLAAAGAQAIGYAVPFARPRIDPGLHYINELKMLMGSAVRRAGVDAGRLSALLGEAELALNADRKLARSIHDAGNVELALVPGAGGSIESQHSTLAESLHASSLTHLDEFTGARIGAPVALGADALALPLDLFARSAAGLGHFLQDKDPDGVVRKESLVLRYDDWLVPSLSLRLAARALHQEPRDVTVHPGQGLRLGGTQVSTDDALRMRIQYYRGRNAGPAFPVYSFHDVISGKTRAEKFVDKIVLVGPTAVALGESLATPVSPAMAPVMVVANAVSSILSNDFIVVPSWTVAAEFGVFMLVALYLILVLPRLSATARVLASCTLFAAILALALGLLVEKLIWVSPVLPLSLLAGGYLALATRQLLGGKADHKFPSQSDALLSDLNHRRRTPGQPLSIMAGFPTPADDATLGLLYQLGVDLERDRQYNKSIAVYRQIAYHDPEYRDLAKRIRWIRERAGEVEAGAPQLRLTNRSASTEDGEGYPPMLGRYRIEKELGSGAMGAVYQGRDPKIGRVVAIKTLMLSGEFAPGELDEVRGRFFHEARTVGRLNHPNIVTVFDAGEDRELAYIAMEFLNGENLGRHTRPETLLPLPVVVEIVARVADALGYAHRNHVVHRDIKPSNIMYEAATDSVKVTDFGIARIADASRTRTGIVLGTPSYMSPEQLTGGRIAGASDLFSLGSSLYQLVSGHLPFSGETMAELMFRIANETPPDIRKLRRDVPEALARVIERALAKQPESRFRSGEEMASALRASCFAARANAA